MDKDDNNFDVVYENSILSITEDAQYPLFDAEKAKEGIFNQNSKAKKTSVQKKPNQDETPKFEDRRNELEFTPKAPPVPLNESEIKLDEPIRFNSDIKLPFVVPRQQNGIFNRNPQYNGFSSIGATRQIGPNTAKPQPVKSSFSMKLPASGELSPRMKMMPLLAQKISNINSNSCFSKVIPKSAPQLKPSLAIPPKPELIKPSPVKPPAEPRPAPVEEAKKAPPAKPRKGRAATGKGK